MSILGPSRRLAVTSASPLDRISELAASLGRWWKYLGPSRHQRFFWGNRQLPKSDLGTSEFRRVPFGLLWVHLARSPERSRRTWAVRWVGLGSPGATPATVEVGHGHSLGRTGFSLPANKPVAFSELSLLPSGHWPRLDADTNGSPGRGQGVAAPATMVLQPSELGRDWALTYKQALCLIPSGWPAPRGPMWA